MKYLLALIAMALGLAIGYFIWNTKPASAAPDRRLVLDQRPGKDTSISKGGPEKSLFSERLSIDDAEKFLSNYKAQYGAQSSIAFSVDNEDVDSMMASGGIRIYLGLKDAGKPESLTLMLVGLDKNTRENVLLQANGQEYVIDYTNPCPKDCPPNDRRTIKP